MGKLRVYCLKTLNKLSIYSLGNTPSAPSASCQASVYDGLIALFVDWWRKLLISHRIIPDWLAKYPVIVKSLSPHPSTRLSLAQTRPATGPANHGSSSMDCESPHPSSPTEPPDEDLDAPLMSKVEADDKDNDYAIDKVEDFDVDN